MQHVLERLDEEVFAPHHRLVDAEILVDVIDAAAENAFPPGLVLAEVLFAQRPQDADGGRPVEVALDRIVQQAAQAQQPGSGDGGRGGVEQFAALGRRVEVPRRNAVGRRMRDVVIGARLRGLEEIADRGCTRSRCRSRTAPRPGRATSRNRRDSPGAWSAAGTRRSRCRRCLRAPWSRRRAPARGAW